MESRKIEAIVSLPAPQRYSHFIKFVADCQSAWGLYLEGWALAATDDDQPVFPIWPAREFAQLCAVADWTGYVPKVIEIDDLMDGLLPSLRESGTLLGVFYTPNDKGILPDTEAFEADMKQELAKFE